MNEKRENNSIQAQFHGFPFKWAENLMDQMEKEQNRTLFGREEKNLLCNYAYHAGNTPEVQAQFREVAASQFEVQHGYIDPKMQKKIQSKIDQINQQWLSGINEKKRNPSLLKDLKQYKKKSSCRVRNLPNKTKSLNNACYRKEVGR